LDQGREGSCCGHGAAHELAARPVVKPVTSELAFDLYKSAQKIDEWPGESYSGTSVLAVMKVMQERGLIGEYRWCLDMNDLIYTVGRGPVVIGVDWYKTMVTPDEKGFIHVGDDVIGGHCLLINGQKVVQKNGVISQEKSYFRLHNSWGQDWGVNGECFISFLDMSRLMAANGDFAVPVKR